jgi:hypothetical protein
MYVSIGHFDEGKFEMWRNDPAKPVVLKYD